MRQESVGGAIEQLRSDGVLILMSTHYIEEAERLCDSVTIMAKWSGSGEGKPSGVGAHSRRRICLEIYGSRATMEAGT